MGGHWHFLSSPSRKGFRVAFLPFPGEYFLLWKKAIITLDRMIKARALGHRQAVAHGPGWAAARPLLVSGPAPLWLVLVKALSGPCFSFYLRTAWLGHCPVRAEGGATSLPNFP